MTDPLSVSASISGLVTLADIVFRRTYKYVKAVKKAPKEISALSAEIGALYGVLSNLQLVSRQLEDETFEATTRIHHIYSCYQTLEHVKSILDRDDTSSLHDQRLETLKRKLRWPFTSSEVKDLIAEIERHKTILGLALNVDCMSGLLQALSRQDEFRDTIEGFRTELKERHEAETRIAINKERQEILTSFAKVDPSSNHDMSRKLRSPGTGLWLTEGQEFRQWLETKNARLWFYGIPGAGKTVLAASVIEEALQTSNASTAMAFFYCDYKDSATQDLSNILGSLAQQFAKQDEESFAKLREFYETHNPEHQQNFKYDSEALASLVRAVTLVFDCAMIIVDGLDECGANTPSVVDSLTALNHGEDTTVKTIFLSRDEIEIRERLESYTPVSIAARSSDLRLYVGAEIDSRTRKKRLRIKDQSLKEHILERLVEGAEGMFRWVTCQMDYMCELPNDAARRKALNSLPPDLNSTYERILNRVNQSNLETQKLVRRALRWIANDVCLATKALCEAVSINFEDTRRNSEAIPDEFEILRWCSSLVRIVRRTATGNYLELAHFTVKEFLTQIDPLQDLSMAQFRIHPDDDDLIFTKVCLTYLNFQDFGQGGPFSQHAVRRRCQEYPFRHEAIGNLQYRARRNLDDPEIFSLMQKLCSPSKPNTFISIMQDDFFTECLNDRNELSYMEDNFVIEEERIKINSGIAEATALHYAAMYDLAKLCSWLIRCGCDVNKTTNFGTPLHCALLGRHAVLGRYNDSLGWYSSSDETVDILLQGGADINCYYDLGNKKESPLSIVLLCRNWNLVLRLLDSGSTLDHTCLDTLDKENELRVPPEVVCRIIDHANNQKLSQENYSSLLQLALKARTSNAIRLIQEDQDPPRQHSHYEQLLRTAAEFGQIEIVTRLLEDQKIDVDAVDESTESTALQQAARTDHLAVAQLLLEHEADYSRSDCMGRTALHQSVQGRGVRCLQLFLQRNADTTLRDLEGMTVWHLAAQKGHFQSLGVLLSGAVDSASAVDLKANDGRTTLLCASASGSKDAMEMLLGAGSSLTETALDGSSSLHYAAESGSLESVRFLIGQGIDPNAVTHDGSNAIHYSVRGNGKSLAEVIHILLENGVDPCKARDDRCTPLHDLVRMIKEESRYDSNENDDKDEDEDEAEKLDRLFAASRTLLKKLVEKSRLASDLQLGSELIYLACSHSFSNAHNTVLSLLELGLDCNIHFANGRTALMAAAESGNGVIFSTLLLHGADPGINHLGLNALHCACFNGHKNILVLLRETGIDWNSRATATIMGIPDKSVTALHIAAQSNNSSILEYLLNENLMSDIDACTNYGETPLIVAVWARAYQNVSLLLSQSVDPSLIDVFGNSPAHWAAKYGDEEAITEFISHGSDLGLTNSFGLTPELLARKYGHETLARIIMNYVDEQNDEPNSSSRSRRPGKTHVVSEALKTAIDIGDLELCTRLVEDGMDLRSGFGGCPGCTPLLYSLHTSRFAIAEYLVSKGASIEGHTCENWTSRGFTAFHYAAGSGSVELLRLLLEKAPSEIYVSRNPIHPVHLAVLKDNAECVKLMLDHASQGMNAFSYRILQYVNGTTKTGKGRTLSDSLGTLQQSAGRIVNMQVRGDMLRWSWVSVPGEMFPEAYMIATPLHIAAKEGNGRIVPILLAYGASVDSEDEDFSTPLHNAASNGQTAMVKLLLDSGANPNAVGPQLRSPCMAAAAYGSLDSVRVLVQGGADIQLRNWYGETALQLAASHGAKDVFVFLMNATNGHDLGAEDAWDRTILLSAMCQTFHFPMSFLLNLAPRARAYESQLDSILNAAVRYRSTTEVKMLLRRIPTNILPKLLDHHARTGGTPLNVAVVLSKLDTINLLLDAGAQLELDGSDHGTALMGACATGRLESVKLLVARGARTSYVKDGQRFSALLAAKYHPEVRRWLLVGRFLEGPKLLTYREVK